jgi:arylsulfatase A-like enzyme
MNFLPKTKKTVNRFSTILALTLSIGFITGTIIPFSHIMANQYVKYKMIRLISFALQESINEWTMVLIVFGIGLILVMTIVRLLVQIIGNVITTLICFLIFIYSVWAVNHFWLPDKFHPVSLSVTAAIVIITVFLVLCSVMNWWEKIFSTNTVKYIWRVGGICITIILLLNLAIVIDKKLNTQSGPNIILIIVDTLRADHLGSYGYGRNTTPNMDRLSSNSILFKNAISHAPWTEPSIGSILTSQYPSVLGIKQDPVVISNKFITLAELLKENGYKTKGIISGTYVSSKLGFDQGFDFYNEDHAKEDENTHIVSPFLVKKAVSFLEKNRDNKFFLFIHDFDPHYNYIQHQKYNYYPDYNGSFYSNQDIKELWKKAPYMKKNDISYIKALYDSEISFTDEFINRLLENLKGLGLYENTLIVLTADHGEEFLERGDYWIGHTKKLYKEQLHVPLMIKLPWSNKGKVIEDYIGLIDLMPTIADLAGLRIPEAYEYDGKSIELDREKRLKNSPIISETSRQAEMQSVTWKQWKFIHNLETGMKELYNLKKDPTELKNIISDNEKILKEMEAILREWNDYTKKKTSDADFQKPAFQKDQIERLKSLGYIQ